MNTNEQSIIRQMENNVGRRCSFQIDDGTVLHGRVSSVSNSEHYAVVIARGGYDWQWYVRAESIRLE